MDRKKPQNVVRMPVLDIELNSPRFLIRAIKPSDVNASYTHWWNDPKIQAGLNCKPRGWTQDRAVEHVKTFNNRSRFHLGIFRKGDLNLVGFYSIFLNPNNNIATVNTVIGDKNYWGAKVIEEIRPLIQKIIFTQGKVIKIKMEIAGHNRSSIAMCKRGGYTLEGVLRDEKKHYQGGRTDLHIFSLLKDEWLDKISDTSLTQ
jgi:RimJ/RimL family protein N-acetyltransferase